MMPTLFNNEGKIQGVAEIIVNHRSVPGEGDLFSEDADSLAEGVDACPGYVFSVD